MAERDKNGHFLPGNKTASTGGRPKQYAGDRKDVRGEIIKCAHSLSRPTATLVDEMFNPNATRLETLTANAVQTKNYKFIQWLLEMAVGRPHQTIDESIVEIKSGRNLQDDSDEELEAKFKMILGK